ncbi:hypothetical protein LZ198_35905 [Myxococcus sp. K15C18031901]|uniref:hypothetical protein n=1 Tax=Myxococcus dinghuensis TaxID=2906761 RepID=UPI0020A7CFCE|nr:hypothetical protein [Myxococcus dinghuensis]MCP3104262.1 hypothetical protein [Myxococcus dinghuensis]
MPADIIPLEFARWLRDHPEKARRLIACLEAWGALKTLGDMMDWAVEEGYRRDSPVTPELKAKTRAEALDVLRSVFTDLGAVLPKRLSQQKEDKLLEMGVSAVYSNLHPEPPAAQSEPADSPRLFAVQWPDRTVSFVYARTRMEAVLTLDGWIADCAPDELVEVDSQVALTLRPKKVRGGDVQMDLEGVDEGLDEFMSEQFPSFFKVPKPKKKRG